MTGTDPFGISGAVVDGRYRVEHVVGQGGFGVVYRAQHLGFESPIALKVLKLPEDWSSARRNARIASFQLEGRMLFELSRLHPSFVRALETGAIRGRDGSRAPYLALEWLDGVSLDRELKARRSAGAPPLPLADVLALLSEPAEGLARAHARGIAHRDIKPGNLFISVSDDEQSVKILDFGIAKLVGDSLATNERFAANVSATASFTPLYAAPEQWLERLGATGTWTDVHALALVVVELLTGSAPFAGRERAELKAACLDQVRPSPAAHGVALAPAVETVLARALALEPQRRFPDAAAFWAALCAAAQWRGGRTPILVELSSLDAHHGTSASLAPVASSFGLPSGSTATTAPPTAARRPARAPSSFLVKSAAAALAAVTASAFILQSAAGRGQREQAPSLPSRATIPSVAGQLAQSEAPRSHPGALPLPASPSPAPAPLPVAARALGKSSTRAPRPRTAENLGSAPAPNSLVPAPDPVAPATPERASGPASSTASFALHAPETTEKRSSLSVNLDDPALLRRK